MIQAATPPSEAAGRSLLVVIDSLEHGGAELQLVAMLPILARRGWEVEVLTVSGREPLAAALGDAGVVVHQPQRHKATRIERLAWLAATLVRRLSTGPKPIVYTVLPYATALAGPLASLVGCRLAIGRRSRNTYQPALPWIVRTLERRAVLAAERLICNSQLTRQDLVGEGAAPGRIVQVPNGVDPKRCISDLESVAALRAELGIGACAFILLTIANLFPYKGHADLLTALSILSAEARLPRDWLAVFVGRDPTGGARRSQLEIAARDLGIAEHVRFVGHRTEISPFLAIADLYVTASHEEGLSNSLLEAMTAGLPIVSTDVGAHAQALGSAETGLLVPVRRPQELARAIARLASDPALRRQLGQRAAARARSAYTLELAASALNEALEGLSAPCGSLK